MKKIIKLTESELNIIIKRVISEISDHTRNLYLSWAKSKSGNYEKALNYLEDFFKYKSRLPKKDFSQYSSIDELEKDILKIKQEEEKTQKESEAVKIHNDENVLVVAANTWEAGCKYGAGTKWCTAAKEHSEYWKRHHNTGTEFIWINKKIKQDNPYYKLSLHIKFDDRGSDWCNAINNCTRKSPYDEILELPNYQEILSKCEEYHKVRSEKYEESKSEIEKLGNKIKMSLTEMGENVESNYYRQIYEVFTDVSQSNELVENILDSISRQGGLEDLITTSIYFDELEEIYKEKGFYIDEAIDEIIDEVVYQLEDDVKREVKNINLNSDILINDLISAVNDNILGAVYNRRNSDLVQEFLTSLNSDWDGTMNNVLEFLEAPADLEETCGELIMNWIVESELDVSGMVDDVIQEYIGKSS